MGFIAITEVVRMKKFWQENRNIVIIATISGVFCIIVSVFKSSKTLNVPYWLYPWGELGYWISVSVIAATIFFIFQTYIPSLNAEYLNRPAVAITFRKLQLMLVRLDNLIVEPYKKVKNIDKVDVAVDCFFTAEFLNGVFDGFDLGQDSPCVYECSPPKYISFKDYFILRWENVKSFADDALRTPYAQTAPELSYQLEYLLSESSFDVVLGLIQQGHPLDYSSILCLDQPDTEICKNNLENIITLHKIAFSLYDILKEDSRLKSIYKPPFYDSQSKA